MQDGMKQGDGMSLSMSCGHPNVQPNEQCPLCGKIVRDQQTISGSEVGKLEDVLGDLNLMLGEKG